MSDTNICLVKSARDVSHADGTVNAMRAAKKAEEKIVAAEKGRKEVEKEGKKGDMDPQKLVSQIRQDRADDLVR